MLSVSIAIVVIAVPGLVTGLAAGLRGWVLAGMAPLLSYAIGGLTGPWTAAMGVSFNAVTYAVSTVVFAAVAFGVRKLTVRRRPPEPEPGLWARRGHLAVLACLLFAAVAGGYATLRGMGRIGVLPQGFDAVYHGNAVRYIAATGDGSLFGTGSVNWYGDAAPVFYPNGYHLLAAVTYSLSGASIPATLDANTVLLPGLLALSLVTLVREFRGRAVLAGAVALTAVAPVMGVYESMDRGPLLPFALGVTLTPPAAVALRRYLERVAPDTGLVLVLAAVGLLCIHSSTLFGGILFAGPLLVQRWLESWRRIGRDLLALAPIAVVSLLVAWLQLFGALGLAESALPYYGWPSEYRATTALGALLGFQHFEPHPQVWLSVALFLGIVFFTRAGALRWIGLTAAVTGLAYLAVASSNASIVMALSRPWWDDPYRFFSMAAIPLTVLAAHGLASTQAWLRDRLGHRLRVPAVAVAVVVLAGFVVLSNGLYVRSNGDRVYTGYQAADPSTLRVTPGEQSAMAELGKLAKPGEWAMNDRFDGTAWTYALTGIRTVAAHFDETSPPADAVVLANRFRDYSTDPAVRAAVRRLNIHWVILGKPSAEPGKPYQPGLIGLAGAPFLREAYRNPDAVIYRLTA
ncbi:hypothetical protein DMA12_32280 [Amycolatopsis balhimycina DSM 5908]|uniref:Copper-transporting ATPase n=1 Tax=Amycolatopsis balhimycina DSM 5908 TaxID=1081091 RepID=A0A428W6I1_AMYBA|nr:DUF6541 family protein [Amycolatopsis balhimycina]RSM38564.1 hypothetical protein DMA12_32280 [Amycolatopsis balhimycina DSM 5908]